MTRLLPLFLLFLSLNSYATIDPKTSAPYGGGYSGGLGACQAFTSTLQYVSSNTCQTHTGSGYRYFHVCSGAIGPYSNASTNHTQCDSGGAGLPETFRVYIEGCPSGYSNPDGDFCYAPGEEPGGPETGDTATGQCRAWSPECNDSTIVDSNGDVWTNDGLGICDMDICLNQYTKTDQTVDPNDPTTWPEGSIASDDINAPSVPGTSEESPFDDWTEGFPAAVSVETDTQTTTNSDGSTSTTTTTTELGMGESGATSTETTETVTTDSSGNTTTTTTTKTTDSSGNVSTSTNSTTTDSGGTVTGSSSSSGTDEGGEQEDDGAKVSGGGSCSSRPVCEGDPVNCAILVQDWEHQCSGEKSLKNLVDDAESELAGQGMTDLNSYGEGELLEEIGVETVDLQTEAGSFLTAPGNTAACPAPQSIDLGQFGTVELKFDLFCQLADLLRYLVLLASYFIGGNIVLRSITNR